MSIHAAGKMEVISCDFCRNPCVKEVFTEAHQVLGGNSDPAVHHFCSKQCRDDFNGVNERIVHEIEKRTRQEFNMIHKQVCPRCTQRLRRLL